MENMENKKDNLIDVLICILAMFFVIWILTILDGKIWEDKERAVRPVWDEGHLRPFDG